MNDIMRNILVWGSLFCGSLAARAEALKILPAETALTGTNAAQRLLVLAEEKGQIVGERTPQAKFSSSHPAVATVDAAGVVRAVGDGEAIITASVDGKQTTAKVSVRKTKEPSAWSFRNHVIPIMTRAGCRPNSMASHCHWTVRRIAGLISPSG